MQADEQHHHDEAGDDAAGREPSRRSVVQGMTLAVLLAAAGLPVDARPARASTTWSNPMRGNHGDVGQRYRPAPDGSGGRIHHGYDIGTAGLAYVAVHAASAGVVVRVNSSAAAGGERGCFVVIDHGGGVRTLYQHLSDQDDRPILVAEGQTVRTGQVIATAGRTSTLGVAIHLHVEVLVGGPASSISHAYTVDPRAFFADRGVALGDDEPVHDPGGGGVIPTTIEEDAMRLFETTTPWGEKIYGYTTASGGAGTLDANQYQHLVQFWPWVAVTFDAFQTETAHAWYRAGEAAKKYQQPAS